MAGTDYRSIAMTVEEWERCDLELSPPHLLAEDEEEKDERKFEEQVMGKEIKKGGKEEISQRPFPADPAFRRL
ncbi:unnamed protein product [Prunus armeniaca]|uniref:Uncharacterized protein n=1 Tax=Prunus armeniaca TaxID=36596 RepID=A0A6J5V6F3_PRUAR|nr:unnamed protein product [Prunus armeniaca]